MIPGVKINARSHFTEKSLHSIRLFIASNPARRNRNCFEMLGKQIIRIVFLVAIIISGLGLSEEAFCKTGTATITSPADNSTLTSNFSVSVSAPLSWVNGVLNNGTFNSYLWSGDGCYYISTYPKLDFYWNGSKDVVGKLQYSIDGSAPVTVQDMYADGGANFTIPINISALSIGSHSVTISTKDVFSTMNHPYYPNGSVSGNNCNSFYVNNCTTSGCHANPNLDKYTGPWQRQDGLTLASATHNFTVAVPVVTSAPGSLSPAHRTFVSPNWISRDNVVFQWSSVANAASYQLVMYETNDLANTRKSKSVQSTSFDTSSDISIVLVRGRKYSWNVQGVNASGSGGPVSATNTFIVGSADCWPEVGTGTGQSHIDTCYDLNSNPEIYRLKDISRRADMDTDGHKGIMNSPNAIVSQVDSLTAGALANNSNSWTVVGSQKKAIDAQVNSGKVYDYFYDPLLNPSDTTTTRRFRRNSFDNSGSSMVSIVENPTAQCGIESACFISIENSVNFTPGSTDSGAIDIVTHEWAHGITATTSKLGVTKELGALNESFSDWMAIAHKQARGSTSWEVIQGGNTVLRNVADPTQSNSKQPTIYKKKSTWTNLYKDTPDWGETDNCTPVASNDYCWIHYNSGVPNRMFSLLASGGSNYEVTVPGIGVGIARAMQIAFTANTTKWKDIYNFIDTKEKMVEAAQDLSATANEINQIKLAWAAVGVGDLPAITTSTPTNPLAGSTVAYRENAPLPVCTSAHDTCIAAHRYKSSCCTNDTYYSPWDKKVTVEATPNPDYYFKSWTLNGDDVSSSPKYTFTVTGDSSLVANFTSTPPVIAVAAPLGDFQSVATSTTSPEHTFIVTNSGTQTLTIAPVQLGGTNSVDFNIASNGCNGQNLSPAATCMIKARFVPSSAGTKTASLTIPAIDPNTPAFVIALSGQSGLPVMTNTIDGVTVNNYSTIQSAYNSAFDGTEVRLWATDFSELLSFNRPVTTTLRGGYDGNFADRVGKTALQGALTISSGTVIIDGLQIGGSSYQSSLAIVNNGSGTVIIQPSGTSCGSSCSSTFINGTIVTLTAVADPYASFTGWNGGDCSGTGSTCTFTLSNDTTVTASFTTSAPPVISVAPSSESFGTVYAGSASQQQTVTVTSAGS